jgi:hypothetical protein
LSGYQNFTRVLFDFLAAGTDGGVAIIAEADAVGASMVVLNMVPAFSPPADQDMLRALRTRYPHNAAVGKFLVLWR